MPCSFLILFMMDITGINQGCYRIAGTVIAAYIQRINTLGDPDPHTEGLAVFLIDRIYPLTDSLITHFVVRRILCTGKVDVDRQ